MKGLYYQNDESEVRKPCKFYSGTEFMCVNAIIAQFET